MVNNKKTSRKSRTLAIALALGFVAVLIGSAVVASQLASPAGINRQNFGGLGSDHKHAAFMIVLDGRPIDFSQDKYQVRSSFMHVEDGDGTTLHSHALFVPFGEFIESVGMDIQNGCFVMDDGTKYCDSNENKVRFIVNGVEQSSIMDYIPKDGDRILIHYGGINDVEQIDTEVRTLYNIPIARK